MNTPPAPRNDDPDLVRWGLVALAMVIGAFLTAYYVQLLHDSVARGAQLRYSQQSTEAPAARVQLARDIR